MCAALPVPVRHISANLDLLGFLHIAFRCFALEDSTYLRSF